MRGDVLRQPRFDMTEDQVIDAKLIWTWVLDYWPSTKRQPLLQGEAYLNV